MVRRRRRLVRALLVSAVVICALAPGAMWLRDSELVGVREVSVTGIEGSDAPAVRRALVHAARDMTTLNVRDEVLRTAVERHPIVRSLRAHADFPHGLRIVVNAYDPVAVVTAGGRDMAVAGDGTLLRGTPIKGLPYVRIGETAATRRVSGEPLLEGVRLMGAAPAPLRARVKRLFHGDRGLTATLRQGPELYFGRGDRPRAQWRSAAAVLSDPEVRGATFVDVRLPERPAVGGLPPVPQTSDKPSTSSLG